ncbi:ATP-binding protein [Actinoplanes sp. LDG1-06]|uniref:ATP-binding protein n=1 Tax=Paractinoplanes ovalisporus TaxID=2810368 RepID=A0ABS2AHS9_9ACTN|nr:ATP-binding protein [Actinoplanes ovalisporus]MBM2619397.1 ATP-binding protein [Actinoplanes ovalisporus]
MSDAPSVRHAALVYRDAQNLHDRLAADPPPGDHLVVLACRAENEAAAGAALAGHEVLRADRPDIHTRPAAALAAYRRLRRTAGTAVTIVAEPETGGTLSAWRRATRCETAVDLALAGSDVDIVCAYPATTPHQLLADLVRAHPALLTPLGRRPNPDHADPADMLRRLAPRSPRAAPPHPPALHITDGGTLENLLAIRRDLAARLAGLPALVRTDFVAAVNEIATNGYLHGAPPLEISLWITGDTIECRVTDHGPGVSDPTLGYRPSPASGRRAGAGLWLARQLCDDIDLWRAGDAFTVRAATAVTTRHNRTVGALARAEIARARADLAVRRRRRR